MEILECIEGCYEVQEVEFGKVFRWCSESVLIECDCGETPTLACLENTCVWCGADHTSTVREKLAARRSEDEAPHPPWR